jgi:hypothetical protein
MSRHCPVTGRPVMDCDCGACDDPEPGEPQDDSEDESE